ncbi:hypothetical protein GLYMA_11G139033v4 [Glycine max]|nr:hypothetical protein GLYMA_11G139033v4 [Glycine max]KAH1159077.1 hypothetical protein GYH30_030999 [Glycine max]
MLYIMSLRFIFFSLAHLQKNFGPGFNLFCKGLLFWIRPCQWSNPWDHLGVVKQRMLLFPLLSILSGQSDFAGTNLRALAILFLLVFIFLALDLKVALLTR